jgi:hypothetical protein
VPGFPDDGAVTAYAEIPHPFDRTVAFQNRGGDVRFRLAVTQPFDRGSRKRTFPPRGRRTSQYSLPA